MFYDKILLEDFNSDKSGVCLINQLNELAIIYNIAWYEQKAVLVLLALLSLGVKNIMLGPTLPAFISPNVLNVLIEKFNISPNSTVEQDMDKLVAGIPAS